MPISEGAYLELLDWTARQRKLDKRGATPECIRPIFERLGVKAEVWFELTEDFGRLFATVAGKPKVVESARSLTRNHRYKVRGRARDLLAS